LGWSSSRFESAGKKKYTYAKRKSACETALYEAAWAATCKSGLAIRFWKMASRRGKKKALVATVRKILTIIYMILKNKTPYIEGGLVHMQPVA